MRPTDVPRRIPDVSPRVMPTTPPTTRVKPYLIPPPVPLSPQANVPNAPELPRMAIPPPASPPLCRSLRHMAPNGPSLAPHRYLLRHQLHLQPTLQQSCYANATAFLAQHEANSVVHPITGALQEYRHLMHGTDKSIWSNSHANEFGSLAQGIRGPCRGHQHNILHPKGRRTLYHQQGHLPTISLKHMPQQGQNVPHTPHCWRKPLRLRRHPHDSNRYSHHSQMSL